jgi:hypothetical protein
MTRRHNAGVKQDIERGTKNRWYSKHHHHLDEALYQIWHCTNNIEHFDKVNALRTTVLGAQVTTYRKFIQIFED